MAPGLASIEWPGLTYLLRRRLEKVEHNGHDWDRFWETWLIVSRTLLLSSTQTDGDCCVSLCWGLVGRAHLVVCGTIGLVCRVSAEFLVTCQLAVCATRLLRSACGQPQLVKWSLIVGKSWVITLYYATTTKVKHTDTLVLSNSKDETETPFNKKSQYSSLNGEAQWRIQPGAGGHAPRWRPGNFFRQYINIITKPTAYDGPREY